MRSFVFATLLMALICVPSQAQFNFPSSTTGNNRYPRYPAQSSFGSSNPNSIDVGSIGSRYPSYPSQSLSPGFPGSGLGSAGLGAGSSYPGSASTAASPSTLTSGNPNTRILGLLGGGGGGGGLFSNLLGALTGRNRNPIGGGGGAGGFYPYPVPAPYPGFSPYGVPSPYGGGFGYPGYGGGFYG